MFPQRHRPDPMLAMLTRSIVQRRALLLPAMLGLVALSDMACSDLPSAPTVVIDCLDAESARLPIVDARDRLIHGFDGETREQLFIGLSQLEIALRTCDGASVQSNLAEVRRVLAPIEAEPFGNESSDATAIDLALDEVDNVLLGQPILSLGQVE